MLQTMADASFLPGSGFKSTFCAWIDWNADEELFGIDKGR